MGDIVSLMDSIQEDYVPHIPMKYKNMGPEPVEEKIVRLDSPTVSVTQVVPAWPRPRDKTGEPEEPDPEPEPTPPPTPPPPMPAEGAEEEEEVVEEEDEEALKRKEEKRLAEEEARRKAEELPPPMPPPPPSPQPEPELEPPEHAMVMDEEDENLSPVEVERQILLAEDAHYRSKLRRVRKKMTTPLAEADVELTPSEELNRPSNFKDLPDESQIIRGSSAVSESDGVDVLPFAAIMAIVTSYKYSINTWTSGIVSFVTDTAKKLYQNKLDKFQLAPVHIIPKIAIGHQAYHAQIDVIEEGPTWKLEKILSRNFLKRYDRGMLTTSNYSCAFFKRNNLYYLYDGSPCNAMGLRDDQNKGKACFLRFRTLQDFVYRVLYNKDGKTEDQQFILSRIIVKKLLIDPRYKLPEDYDYNIMAPKSKKSRPSIVSKAQEESIDIEKLQSEAEVGYQLIEGIYKIEGSTALKDRSSSPEIKSCHFVCLMAMLMATMHPIKTWDHFMVDTCIEKGLEIYSKATNLGDCDKRVIKNVIIDGKFISINIKKILVINENPKRTLDQYMKAVLARLRYVIIKFPQCSLVVCQTDGYFNLFDPYSSPNEDPTETEKKDKDAKKASPVATWTLYKSEEALIRRIKKIISKSVDSPEFYTFELTSVKIAPRHSALNYRLSPLFKSEVNPNMPYLKKRRSRPIVDEKMYWLSIDYVPWSRMNPVNDLGLERNKPETTWKAWDIEFPGDLFSLWGTVHPLDLKFEEEHRGKQYLAVCVVALMMTKVCKIGGWTGSFLDGIVNSGNKYHIQCVQKIGNKSNFEITVSDLDTKFNMFPFQFTMKFEKIIFGFVYNIYPDRFNLSKALVYFFEKNDLGVLVSPPKNLAFGKSDGSYFMYDCQSYGLPIFCPGQGASYMLKCESLNRLIYCMTITLNIRRHGQQFHLYSVAVSHSETAK